MQDIKRHAISIAITFIATFFFFLSLAIKDDSFVFTKEALNGVVIGAIFAGVREVAKLIYEICLSFVSKKKVIS